LSEDLWEGEDILWNGKPERMPFVIRWLPAIFLGLAVVVLPMLWITLLNMPQFCLLLSLFGSLWTFIAVRYALCTRYTITNERIILRDGAIGRNSIGLDDIAEVFVEIGDIDSNVGSIAVKTHKHGFLQEEEDLAYPGSKVYRLHVLSNPYDICKLLEEAIRKYNAALPPLSKEFNGLP